MSAHEAAIESHEMAAQIIHAGLVLAAGFDGALKSFWRTCDWSPRSC